MSVDYRFWEVSDENLIRVSNLVVEQGIAVAVRTTGYQIDEDEAVQISIVDFAGNELFARTVKPQNREEWQASEASGGLSPEDVCDAPELYEFEDEISALFENASIVVGEHMDFVHHIIETSWVSLPEKPEFSLVPEFCQSHCTVDYPTAPAAVASLQSIAAYYDITQEGSDVTAEARMVAASYLKLVEEHAFQRVQKGEEHWAAYERKQEQAAADDRQVQAAERVRTIKQLRTSAIMWLCAAAIFSNLAVQLYIRAFDFGFVAVSAAAAIYFAVRWIMSLYAMFKLRKQK